MSCDCNDSSCRGTGSIAGATGFGANQSTARGGATGGAATQGVASGTTPPSTVVAAVPTSGGSTAIGPSLITFGGVPGATSLGLGGAVTSPAGGSVHTLGGSSGTIAVAMGGVTSTSALALGGSNAGGSNPLGFAGAAGTTTITAGSGNRGGAASTSATSPPSAGAGSTVACMLGKTDLMLQAAASPGGNWIGGDLTRSDDPCGFQGVFYAYSDPGFDGVPDGIDDTLVWPAWVEGNEWDNPCANGKCCIQGVTRLFPKLPDGTDDMGCCWGAGLGLSLAAADGSIRDNLAYVGPARGFRIGLEGELNAGQQIHIAYTQSEVDESAPFVPYTSLGTNEVLFQNVACPYWATDCTETGSGGAHPYDLQVLVEGGYTEGSFRVCITSLVPIL